MVDIKSIYKYVVKLGAILMTCIFIGTTVNFIFRITFLGQDAYNYNGGYTCQTRYNDSYNSPNMPKAEAIKAPNQAEWVKSCEENDAAQQAFNYKKGVFDDVAGIVSLLIVSLFLWVMDRKNS